MDSDEALARLLQEEYRLEMEALESDSALARQLQDKPVLGQKNSGNRFFLSDYALALKLEKEEEFHANTALAKSRMDAMDESILHEDNPDLHQLFYFFNRKYFNDRLNAVEVKWSTKMTRCAGTCTHKLGGHCIVALSEPLLKFRTKQEMMETLLHEMIHALLFLCPTDAKDNLENHDHGPAFLREMNRINQASGLNITVYHHFHDEVDHYLTHIWQCNGPCQNTAPYYGLVKRSMNRPPQPADTWYQSHQRECGGTYTKISGPPAKRKRQNDNASLDKYFNVKAKKPQ